MRRMLLVIVPICLLIGCGNDVAYDSAERSTWPSQAMDVPAAELGRMALSAHVNSQLAKLDTTNPVIDLDEIIATTYLFFHSIPALTLPERLPLAEATYPPDDGRVVVIEVEGETAVYPLGILAWHEIVNDEVGGVPVAVVYCPLCDSVSVFERTMPSEGGADEGETEPPVLEFAVTGLLYQSNVVMFERTTMAIWSQVEMRALTGPHAGRSLRHLPFAMMTMGRVRREHPEARVLSRNIERPRPYDDDPYEFYRQTEQLLVELPFSDALPVKALGLGIHAEGFVAFVPLEELATGTKVISTGAGDVRISVGSEGYAIESFPEGVQVIQTYWFAWATAFPETEILQD